MSIRSIAEIAGRIKFLERFKLEFAKKRAWTEVKRLDVALKELYWVLGVKEAKTD